MSDDIKDKPRSLSPASAYRIELETAAKTSLPPGEKAKTARLGLAFGAFTDWFLISLIAAGIYVDKLAVEPWAYIAVGLGSPAALAGALKRFTGKGTGAGSASALLFAIAGKVGVGGAIKSALLGLVPMLLLLGCGASVYDSAMDARNATATVLNESQPVVVLLCQADPGQRCTDARKAYEVAEASVAALDDALEAYRVTGQGLEAVHDAFRKAAESVREVRRVAAR